MKFIITLLWITCVFATGIILHILGYLNLPSLLGVLAFSVLGGLAIANYNLVKRWKGFGVEFEAFQKEIDEVKDKAIQEVKTEVENQRKIVALLASCVTELTKKLEGISQNASQLEGAVTEARTALDSVVELLPRL